MGKRSTKENKNVYQLRREDLDLARDKAAALTFVSKDRIEQIELKDVVPRPDEVLAMAEGYKMPSLCNHYCSTQCPIGQKYSFKVDIQDLPTIVLQTVASLNAVERHKERFIEIAADCKIDESEVEDFEGIQAALAKISMAVESLRLWSEQEKAKQG